MKIKSNYIYLIVSFFLVSCTKTSNTTSTQQVNAPVPNTPTSLVSTLNSLTIVNLSWSDQSTNELGFKIERKVDSGNYILIATVGPNITAYQDINLSLNSSYTYRVYSYNSGGNSNSYSNTVSVPGLRDGLIAYFPFNGNANDESNNGNNGVVQGAISGSDRFGNSNRDYIFNGVDSKIVVNNNTLALTGPFSISCWIKINNLTQPSYDGAIVSQIYNTRFLLSYRSWAGEKGMAFYYTAANAKNFVGLYAKNWSPFLSQWYNCILTYNPNTNVTCYINGLVQFTSNIVPANLTNPVDNQITIGSGGNSFYFNGEIDDVRFYNKVLNSNEISYLNNF
jgi:hypothetical protein